MWVTLSGVNGEITTDALSDEEWEDQDAGDLPDIDFDEPAATPDTAAPKIPDPEPLDISPDPQPAHMKRGRGRRSRGVAATTTPKVTQTVKRDVRAKIALIGVPLVKVIALRDPLCGGALAEVAPAKRPPEGESDLYGDLAEIVCESPALLRWFTGTKGGYMAYLNLAMTLLPVIQTMAAHHLLHTVGGEQLAESGIPDWNDYTVP